MIFVSSCRSLCSSHWSQLLSREWRCSWSSADRRCSNYIWVINNVIACKGATYIRDFMVIAILPALISEVYGSPLGVHDVFGCYLWTRCFYIDYICGSLSYSYFIEIIRGFSSLLLWGRGKYALPVTGLFFIPSSCSCQRRLKQEKVSNKLLAFTFRKWFMQLTLYVLFFSERT